MPRRTTVDVSTPHTDPLDSLEHDALVRQVRSLLVEAQALSSRLAALNEVAATMQASLDVDKVLRTMVQQARWVIDFQHCSIVLQDESGYRHQVLHGAATTDAPTAPYTPSPTIMRTLQHGHAAIHRDGALPEAPPDMRCGLILPLTYTNQTIGTLNFFARSPHCYSQDDLRIAYALAVQVAAVLQNAHLFAEATRARDELHTVLESISDAVLVIDLSGRIMLLNSSLRRLLHLGEDDLIGRRALWLLRAHMPGQESVLREQVRTLIQQCLNTSAANVEGRLRLADGRHVEWCSAPLVEGSIAVGYVLTIRDVSARVELEQLRDDMINMLVHDLRSPLTSILPGFDLLELIQNNGTPDERRETVAQMRQGARRMLEHVNTLLDVSKLEAGRLTLDRNVCLLRDLVDVVTVGFAPLAQHHQQQISLELPDNLPILNVDVRLLKRVLENLLGNAIKFTPLGGEITIGATHDVPAMLDVWVRDTGPGVPEEAQTRIFEKYGQVQDMQHTGTGLGLTFCKLVVEAHGGEIGVRDAAGGGSEFWLRLPVT